MGIHNYDRGLVTAKKRVLKAEMPEKSKELILAMNDGLVLNGLSKPRLMKYLEVLKVVGTKLDMALDEVVEDDLKKIVSEIQQSNFSPWTKQTYKVIIRRFYKWLHKSEDYPAIVKWINIRMNRSETKLPSEGDLLNEEDIKKLLKVAEHPRDKAFVSMLWESGARISELGNLKIKHVSFDKFGTVITVQGKTGSRKIRLISSTPYASTWINSRNCNGNDNLWINIGPKCHKKAMTYSNLGHLLKNLFRKAEIHKRSNAHLFRHSRATFMANHLTEFQMNQYFGWIQGSDMPSTYVHMSGKNVDNAILQMNGFEIEENSNQSIMQPKKCVRCDTINANESKYCLKCGGVMDIQEAMNLQQSFEERKEADSVMDRLMKDKEVQRFLMEKMKGLGNNVL
jgi:integrase/recombinase XerD